MFGLKAWLKQIGTALGVQPSQPPVIIARPPVPVPPTIPGPKLWPAMETVALDLMNAERERRNLIALRQSDLLRWAAVIQADDLSVRNVLDDRAHTGSDGSTLAARMDRVGYRWVTCAENAAQADSPTEAVFMWMESPGHRANILGGYTEIGVASFASRSGARYWIATFGVPRP